MTKTNRLIDTDDIHPHIEAIAEEYPGRRNDDGFYSAPCFVGEILNRLGVEVPEKFDGARFSRIPWVRIGHTVFTLRATDLLQQIQDESDEGMMWGEAVEVEKVSAE